MNMKKTLKLIIACLINISNVKKPITFSIMKYINVFKIIEKGLLKTNI